ncbi:DUF3944 domain-containing protein [Helicobacter pylori]|nr:DUF3944 domain-containing protein [Helicobacter pylori]
MAYRHDEDLEFLKRLSSNDLKDLFDVLVYDEDGTLRVNEELQCYGGNTFINFLETKGSYTKRFCAMRAII